jgi:hypothetical protein
MKLVYAVSQRTKSRRPTARHIDNGEGKPLCGGNGREPFFWAPEEGEPTCKICLDLVTMRAGETDKNQSKNMS